MNILKSLNKKNRVLLRELVVTDFKLRYQGSVLGYTWSLLKPLFLFAIMYVVFGQLVKLGEVEHYSVYLLLGIVLWTFFAEATNQGMSSIVSRGDLLRKISFPKYILVISATVSALINLFLNLVVVGILMLINGVSITGSIALFPLYIIELYLLALGLAFFLSSLNVRFRDVGHIWEVIMQAAFYATPIIYPLTFVIAYSPKVAQFLLLNPVAQAIQDSRYAVVTKETITQFTLSSSVIVSLAPFILTIIVFVGGSLFFRLNAKKITEYI